MNIITPESDPDDADVLAAAVISLILTNTNSSLLGVLNITNKSYHGSGSSISSGLHLPLTSSAAGYPVITPPSSGISHSTAAMAKDGKCNVIDVDVSTIKYPGEPWHMPLWEIIFKCVVIGILMLIAVVGNLLIIIIVSMSRKMRTTTNFYIMNLAVADLLVACFPMWIYVTTNVTEGWIVGAFLCKFNAFVSTSAMCTISFTMMAIAGDRFFAIVYPLKARVTKRKVKVVVVIVWICALAIGIPPLLYYRYTERNWKNRVETFCSDVWPMRILSDGTCDEGKVAKRIYWTMIMAALNWIPMIMMTINYTVIIHRLQFSRVTHNGSDSMSAVQRRSAKRVVKMLFILLITFIVCTVPFQVSTIYEAYKDSQSKLSSWYQPVYFSAINLMYAHSTVNPIVYGAMNQTFRNGFRQLINRIRNKQPAKYDSTHTAIDTIRPTLNIKVVDKEELGPTIGTSLTDLIQSSSHLSLAVLPNGDHADKLA